MIDNNNIKSATNREQTKLEINRAVMESYTSTRKIKNKNDIENNTNKNLEIKVNTNYYLENKVNTNNNLENKVNINNLENKDNNINNLENKVNTNDNLENKDNNENKQENEINKEVSNNQNQNQNNNITKNIPSYSPCSQINLTLTSHKKSFDLPLSINNSAFSYLISLPVRKEEDNSKVKEITEIKEKTEIKQSNEKIENQENKEKNSFSKNLTISNSCIFIGGAQNLKGMRIHISNHKNNIVHKEITDFKINKNKPVEKVEISLSENKTNNNLSNYLEEMKKRWKEAEKEYKMRLTLISNNDSIVINKKKYIDDLIKTINIDSSSTKNSNNNNRDNKNEYYILIKKNKNYKNNPFIYQVIVPTSNKELETSINEFILNNNQEMNLGYYQEKYSKRTSQNYIYFTKDKIPSKFNSNSQSSQNLDENNNDNNQNINSNNKEDNFNPIFIFSHTQLKTILEDIDKRHDKKINKNPFSVNNNSSLNNEKKKKDNLKNSNNNKLSDLNFNIYPVKGEKFEIIPNLSNEMGIRGNNNTNNNFLNLNANNNIDVSNIALNQSDYNYEKQMKSDSEYSYQKIKETEDFSQNTPISLLQEKYFLYAVSKWAKYSIINPQEQFYIKFSYSSGHPKFDPILLDMTNFTLWIEKIQTKKDIKKTITNSSSSNIYLKNKSSKKINNTKSRAYKSGASIFLNDTNHNNEGNNQIYKKKSKSKPKVDKKKNQ